MMMEGISDATTPRMESLGSIGEDGSLQARQYMYRTATLDALLNPLGEGLGSTVFDSGYVTILWQLGWLGGGLYLGGLFWLVWIAIIAPSARPPDQFTAILAAVALGYVGLLAFGTEHIEVAGCVLWSFLGLVLASRRYHNSQEPATPPSSPAPADTPVPA
jgi:hypothetical protein